MINIIIVLIVAAVLAAAITYIIKAKKRGKTCIGCPCAGTCAKKNGCACATKKEG